MATGNESPGWTFLSNHSHVLICIYKEPEMRLRDIAIKVGITERAVHRIITDLEVAGAIAREKEGRRNRYFVTPELPLRHVVESHRTVGDLLKLME